MIIKRFILKTYIEYTIMYNEILVYFKVHVNFWFDIFFVHTKNMSNQKYHL